MLIDTIVAEDQIIRQSVSEENKPSALVADKKSLLEFLDKNGYAIFWTIQGEKQFIGGSRSGSDKYRGRLEINGAYYFDSRHKLNGGMKSVFDSPKKTIAKRKIGSGVKPKWNPET